MFLLAFETSCDDTSIALFEDDRLVAMRTRSQIREHNETKWVVPEVAARLHANVIFDVLGEVLEVSGKTLQDIELIACTEHPGLMPSLLVGMTVAKTLSHTMNIPYLAIDHIEGHMFANFLERSTSYQTAGTGEEKSHEKWWSSNEKRAPEWVVHSKGTMSEEAEFWVRNSHFAEIFPIPFPSICLTVSGGHNEIYLWKSLFEREKLGETMDDSAGEAFDKVARMMGLGYPGGPIVSKLADEYSGVFRGIFPEVILSKESLDFSFSGLKSAVKREVDLRKFKNPDGELTKEDVSEISFEFQETVVRILSHKLFLAAGQYGIRSVILAGGVSANDHLKETIAKKAEEKWMVFHAPISRVYSQDNAAMIGILAYYRTKYRNF